MKLKKTYKVILTIVLIIVGILVLINVYVIAAPQFGKPAKKEILTNKAVNANYKKGKFYNTDPVPVMLPKSYGKLIKTALTTRQGRQPEIQLPTVKPEFSIAESDTDISAIWLGHSTVLVRVNGITVLTDPVFGKRASPLSFVGPRPFDNENTIDPEALPKPDIIVISHDHFDHLDHKTIQKYYSHVPYFVVPLGIASHLKRWGISDKQIIEFDWWQQESLFNNAISITATPTQHFSGRRKQDNSTLWCSWVIKSNKQKIFFSGDSGYGDHFKIIGQKYQSFELALMECGAYGDYWPYIHMKPEETVQASIDIGSQLTLPIHWGKYNLAFHSWTDPIERFISAANEYQLAFTTPIIGQELILNKEVPKETWWK